MIVILIVICSMVYTVFSNVFGVFVMLVSATKPSDKLNPHMPSGPVHPYQLDESIPILGVSGVFFHFYSISNRYSY